MTKTQIKELIKSAVNSHKLCGVSLKFDNRNSCVIPLSFGEKLFLSAAEQDFLLDGFSIRRFRDATKAVLAGDMYQRIIESEGLLDNLKTPDVDVTDWNSVFTSLSKMNKNVIVESEDEDPEKSGFAIGKIFKVCKNKVYIKHFDADGVWENEPVEIPYSEITLVTFGSRYVETFSKYV